MIAYLVTNLVNGKKYVGITSTSAARRWRKHVFAAQRSIIRKQLILKAIVKYGENQFVISEIVCTKSWNELCEVENILINQFNTFHENGCGYNMTLGGEGCVGYRPTPDTIARIAAAKKGRKHSLEHRANISAGMRAGGRMLRTYRHPPEIMEPMRLANVGKVLTEEHRAKISAANNGKKRNAEQRERVRQSIIGRKASPETKQKMREAHRKLTITAETRAKMGAARSLSNAQRRLRLNGQQVLEFVK